MTKIKNTADLTKYEQKHSSKLRVKNDKYKKSQL